MKKTTMRDIGKAVGVSAVTVSKALAGKSGMSEAMRERIEKKAHEMGYVYPGMARMTSNQHLDIGILIPEAFFDANSFYANLYKRLVQQMTEAGHYALLELIDRGAEERLELPKILQNRRVNGLILLGQPRKEYYRSIAEQEIPVVFLDFYDEQASADAVVGDNSYGCYRLTSHLIKNGHSRIGFVGNYRATSSIMDRYLGFYRAMLSHQLPLRQDWVVMDRDLDNRLLEEFSLPEEMPTAFVCNCDVVARRLIRQMEKKGLRVPEDISITGYDDFETETAPGPGISTFRVDLDAMVETAVKDLMDRRAGLKTSPGRTVISGHPIYRESEGPLVHV
ncbi:MAG: LacI family DNA-binding transcriptional regulator [Clostridia bacterium]|nr:LacI family DNA-binding transcriptional regulator [Clostridia bacterium]